MHALLLVHAIDCCHGGTQLERELESVRASAHPTGIKDKEAELQRAKEEARRLGEERAKAQKVCPCCVLLAC